MKRYLKPKYIVLGIAIVVFCFVPMIKMPYEVIVQKQFFEEYTTLEPYTVLESMREPYTDYSRRENESSYALPNPGPGGGQSTEKSPNIERSQKHD